MLERDWETQSLTTRAAERTWVFFTTIQGHICLPEVEDSRSILESGHKWSQEKQHARVVNCTDPVLLLPSPYALSKRCPILVLVLQAASQTSRPQLQLPQLLRPNFEVHSSSNSLLLRRWGWKLGYFLPRAIQVATLLEQKRCMGAGMWRLWWLRT